MIGGRQPSPAEIALSQATHAFKPTDAKQPVRRESLDVLERARCVSRMLDQAAPRIEAASALPDDVLAALHEAGMFRLLIPRALGGEELDLVTYASVMEIIAAGDASTAWCMGQGSGCSMASAFMEPAAASRLFGPRNAVLAWGAGIQGRATAVDGGYRVTGKWSFASGSRHATLLGGHSFVFEADGTPRLKPSGRQLDRTMLFTRDKATVHDVWDVMGLRGTGSDTFEVTDLFVPADETVDRDDEAARRETGRLYKFSTSLAYGIGFSALQVGIAGRMIDDLRGLAMTKTPRGAPSSLREDPVFQSQLAKLTARLRAARAYLHATIDEAQQRADEVDSLTIEDRASIKLATTHVIQECANLTTEAYRAAGATAIFPANPFERRLRDALTASQQVQGRAGNLVTIGRCLLGLDPDTIMFL